VERGKRGAAQITPAPGWEDGAVRLLLLALLVALAGVCVAAAADGDKVYGSSEDIFDDLREQRNPDYYGSTVEDALDDLAEGGEVDEGSYPASEIWDRDFDLRREKPEKVRISGRTYYKISNDDITGVDKFEKELELNAFYDDWASYFRFSDVNVFAENDDPFRWEKGQVRWKQDDIKVTAGSFSALFGRGLSLNLFEERTLDFDNEIEGVKIEYEIDDVDITALAGQHKKLDELHHSEVTGARVDFPVGDDVTVGVNVVNVQFPDPLYREDRQVMLDYDLVGQDVKARVGPVTFFGEAVQLSRPAVEDAANFWDMEGEDGRGYYANLLYSGDNYSVNLEYKDYEFLEHPFTVLPPVRQFSEYASAYPNDNKGYAAHLNWNPFEDGSYFTFGYAQDNLHDGFEMYREASAIYNSPVTSDITWVAEYWNVFTTVENQEVYRLTLNRELTDEWTASTFLERERYTFSFEADSYLDYIAEAELAYMSELNLIYTYETTGNDTTGDQPDNWGIWEVKYRPDDEQEWNLVYGSRREGVVCSGGICRNEPAFDGIKIDYLWRF
jgi:hypothetical protein